jgi:uncharacterized protein
MMGIDDRHASRVDAATPTRGAVSARRPRPAWLRLAATIVLGTAFVVAVLPIGLVWIRTHPARAPLDDDPGRHGLAFEQIAFASPLDGTVLRGWYIAAPRSTGRVLVIAPGIDANRLVSGISLELAASLAADGVDVLAFDLRAQGESDGDTLSFGAREQLDVLGAVAAARARGARHVAVLGFSMGAASALLAAARTPDIEALVLDSAYADWPTTFRHALRSAYRLPGPLVEYCVLLYAAFSGTDPESVAPAAVIGSIAPRPMLFIAGSDDAAVDPGDGAALAAAAGPSAAFVLVPGAGHVGAFAANPAAYTARIRSFLEAALPDG